MKMRKYIIMLCNLLSLTVSGIFKCFYANEQDIVKQIMYVLISLIDLTLRKIKLRVGSFRGHFITYDVDVLGVIFTCL